MRASRRVLLLAMAGFECLPRLGFQWLQTAELLLQLGEGFAGALGRFERSLAEAAVEAGVGELFQQGAALVVVGLEEGGELALCQQHGAGRSEEHTSELQSRENLVCRLLLEKKKKLKRRTDRYYKQKY